MTLPRSWLVGGGVLLLLAAAAPFLMSGYDLNLLGRFLALSLTAIGLVVLWDDGDDLHAEPRAPYPHAREVLALRAHRAGAP